MVTDLLCMRLCSELSQVQSNPRQCKAEVGLSIWSSRRDARAVSAVGHQAHDAPWGRVGDDGTRRRQRGGERPVGGSGGTEATTT